MPTHRIATLWGTYSLTRMWTANRMWLSTCEISSWIMGSLARPQKSLWSMPIRTLNNSLSSIGWFPISTSDTVWLWKDTDSVFLQRTHAKRRTTNKDLLQCYTTHNYTLQNIQNIQLEWERGYLIQHLSIPHHTLCKKNAGCTPKIHSLKSIGT